MKKRESALRALTSGALAVTGGWAGNAGADSPVERASADYNFSFYSEGDLSTPDVAPLDEESRYEVKMHQFRLEAPLPFTSNMDFALELVNEDMSGASPTFVQPSASFAPVQAMSGATIEDTRNDILFSTNYYLNNGRLGFGTGYSTENDYQAINATFDGETHFNEKNTTLGAGLGFSYDTIEPTDGDIILNRPEKEDKQTYTLNLGLSQILSRGSNVQSSLTYAHPTGYLSDPYKEMFVLGNPLLPDNRPDARNQLTWLTRYRGYVRELDGTFHADYQFYIDDWGIQSHTVEIAWHKMLWDQLRIVPSLRYYSQTEADFYEPFFLAPPAGGEWSSDYRLSAYGALGFGLKADWFFRVPWTGRSDFKLTLGWEHYVSSGDLALVEVETPAPGLVNYNVFTIGIAVLY